MYAYAGVGYGLVPPKFNGGAGLVVGDNRHWGKDLWYQNTRELMWPMCVPDGWRVRFRLHARGGAVVEHPSNR